VGHLAVSTGVGLVLRVPLPGPDHGGQSRGRDAPGATSALLGAAQFTFGAAASPLIGLFATRSAAPMALVMGAFLALATLGAIVCLRQNAAEPTERERH
jgi:MFS transporter, DHA1 family, multidrug resistance protein